jgi:hypothetical protein
MVAIKVASVFSIAKERDPQLDVEVTLCLWHSLICTLYFVNSFVSQKTHKK